MRDEMNRYEEVLEKVKFEIAKIEKLYNDHSYSKAG